MRKTASLTDRDRRILELMAGGASAQDAARRLGYSFGSMRVYLHYLYRKIGVNDRTNAVIWYHERLALPALGQGRSLGVTRPPREESFGDMALRLGLHAALGFMGRYLGSYGRVWEVASRLRGRPDSSAEEERRARSRALWEALLKDDIGHVRMTYGHDAIQELLRESPSDAVLLAMLLMLGGDLGDGERIAASLVSRKTRPIATASELALLRAFRDALTRRAHEPLARLHHLAAQNSASPAVGHTALVALFHAYRARQDLERARAVAEVLWAKAENACAELQSMGEVRAARDATLPAPPRPAARRPAAPARKTGTTAR